MTTGIAIAVGLLLGGGLVVSQLLRLRAWLQKAPPAQPPEGKDPDDSDDQ